jgi:hypothetical protein
VFKLLACGPGSGLSSAGPIEVLIVLLMLAGVLVVKGWPVLVACAAVFLLSRAGVASTANRKTKAMVILPMTPVEPPVVKRRPPPPPGGVR